jgi:hypothetical protein
MSILRKFALVYGIVFVAVGLAGFVPGLLAPHSHPDVHVTAGLGLLFGLFPVNVLHDAAHIGFGAYGLIASRTDGASRLYAQVVAVGYGLLTVMGFVTAMNLHTTFGLLPLYGHDVWLHAVLALGAAYFGFMRPLPGARAVTSR